MWRNTIVSLIAVGLMGALGAPCGWAADEGEAQVEIEAEVLEADSTASEQLGVDWEDLPSVASDEGTDASVDAAEAGGPGGDVAAIDEAAVQTSGGGTGLISVDFKDADIRQVLRIISLKAGVDIVAGTDVEGLVTIKLTNVPWERALGIILRTYGFTYEREENIVRVMTLDALSQEALVTKVFPLDYAKASAVPDVINDMLSDRGNIKYDERTNTVIVTDIPTVLFQIEEVIKRIDWRTPQVLIATKIVETKLEKDENLGIRWMDSLSLGTSATAVPTTFPFPAGSTLGSLGREFLLGTGAADPAIPGTSSSATTAVRTSTDLGALGVGTLTGPVFSATLNFLKQRADTKIISNPTLAVLDNQEAKIHIGDEVPVPTFSIDADSGQTNVSGFETRLTGTVLAVTPHVNPSGEVVVDLAPEVITPAADKTYDVGEGNTVSLPRFTTQTVKTQVRVANGDTIAIGGLVKELEVKQENRVWGLGDLPIVGLMFKNIHRFGGASDPTLKQDLLIFLTVNLMEEAQADTTVASTVEP